MVLTLIYSTILAVESVLLLCSIVLTANIYNLGGKHRFFFVVDFMQFNSSELNLRNYCTIQTIYTIIYKRWTPQSSKIRFSKCHCGDRGVITMLILN